MSLIYNRILNITEDDINSNVEEITLIDWYIHLSKQSMLLNTLKEKEIELERKNKKTEQIKSVEYLILKVKRELIACGSDFLK
jgi:hypothetical protein